MQEHYHVWRLTKTGNLACDECEYQIDPDALLDRIAEMERQHAAAMAVVRAVGDARLVSTDFGWCLCSDASMDAASEWREQARALVAGETREEAGE